MKISQFRFSNPCMSNISIQNRKHWANVLIWSSILACPILFSPSADGSIHDLVAALDGHLTHLDNMWNYAAGVRCILTARTAARCIGG